MCFTPFLFSFAGLLRLGGVGIATKMKVCRVKGFGEEIFVWANVAVLCTAERPNGNSKPKYNPFFHIDGENFVFPFQ